MRRVLLIILSTGIAFFLGMSHPLKAQNSISVPYESMPNYSIYREELFSKEWQPVVYDSGALGYGGFPELSCGNRLCTAAWRHESGQRDISIVIWPDGELYRVAPAVN